MAVGQRVADLRVVGKASGLDGHLDFVDVVEVASVALVILFGPGQVVDTENHVLRRIDDRLSVCRVQKVRGAEHEGPALQLCCLREGHVDCHLVSVEVSVEGMTYERMELEGLAVDQNRLEGLDSESVQRRRTVEHDGMLLDDLVQH